MEITIFLAKAWGLLLVIASFSLLINPEGFKKVMHYMKNEGNIFVAGYLTLVIGILSVLAHNIWNGGTVATIITVLGWITLVKGTLRIMLPSMVAGFIKHIEKHYVIMKIIIVVSLAFGIYLLLLAF